MNVLVAESDSYFASKGTPLIEKLGHTVQWSNSSQDVLNKVRKMRFDLIFLDTSFQEKTVYDMITELKETQPGLKIVAVTENNSGKLERGIRRLGIAYYMIKPFPEEELKDI